MRIYACIASRNEGDIIEASLRHTLAEGVDQIIVADRSDPGEGTRETLVALWEETRQVEWFDAPDPDFRQSAVMSDLAHRAYTMGADWVIPMDVDEFWHGTKDRSIREALTAYRYHSKLLAQRFLHHDWEHRQVESERLPKVAFRAHSHPRVAVGQHDCASSPGGIYDVLEVREIPYRGYEHFKRKIAERAAAFNRQDLGIGGGEHVLKLEGATEAQLEQEWAILNAVPCVVDPIPSRSEARPR